MRVRVSSARRSRSSEFGSTGRARVHGNRLRAGVSDPWLEFEAPPRGDRNQSWGQKATGATGRATRQGGGLLRLGGKRWKNDRRPGARKMPAPRISGRERGHRGRSTRSPPGRKPAARAAVVRQGRWKPGSRPHPTVDHPGARVVLPGKRFGGSSGIPVRRGQFRAASETVNYRNRYRRGLGQPRPHHIVSKISKLSSYPPQAPAKLRSRPPHAREKFGSCLPAGPRDIRGGPAQRSRKFRSGPQQVPRKS